MLRAGLVAVDHDNKWAGGRYYLLHLARCVENLNFADSVSLCSVSWGEQSSNDPFAEVREQLGRHIAVTPPLTFVSRLVRRVRRSLMRTEGARDLFETHGIDVFFPIPPCENTGTPYVFWLPDFQYMRRPDLMSEKHRGDLEQYFRGHVHAAAQIVLSSEDARNDFAKVYTAFLDRTHVVRFCSVPDDEWWSHDPAQVADRYGLPERFMIVCNQFTRHKNHLVLMQAIKLVVDSGVNDIHLVCTGSTFDHRQEDYVGQVTAFLQQNDLVNRVHILGLIPRADQVALLRRSLAIVQPSSFEGWSTIIEDAKTLGKPVLVSDLPVHHEQLGPSQPYYLSQDSPEEWAIAITAYWRQLSPGPSIGAEGEALIKLEQVKRECGLAFGKALRAAVPAPS